MAVRGSGIRDTAKVLKMSAVTEGLYMAQKRRIATAYIL